MQWNMFYDDLEPQGESTLIPKYLWMLRHRRRPTANLKPTPGKYKAIYDMDKVRGVFSHGTLVCTTGQCYILRRCWSFGELEGYCWFLQTNNNLLSKKHDRMILKLQLSTCVTKFSIRYKNLIFLTNSIILYWFDIQINLWYPYTVCVFNVCRLPYSSLFISGWCYHGSMAVIPVTNGYIGHFSKSCGNTCKSEPIMEDKLLQRYKEQVSTAVEKVLRKLQLL